MIGRILAVSAAVVWMVSLPAPAAAGEATERLRPAIDQVLRILDDPALKGGEHQVQRRAALRAVMREVIDFPEAARRALGAHWQERSEADRKEFVALFEDLVTYSYIARMEPFAGSRVVFVDETPDDGATTVGSRIEKRQGSPIPVNYRMHLREQRWLVFDVVAEGISLVANYRAQFNTVIRSSSYAELVSRIKTKVGEMASAPS